jgi:hypothetical protein
MLKLAQAEIMVRLKLTIMLKPAQAQNKKPL